MSASIGQLDKDRVEAFDSSTRVFFGKIRWVIKSKKPVNTAFHELSNIFNIPKSGGEENRTVFEKPHP
jgi:hypothetical protein